MHQHPPNQSTEYYLIQAHALSPIPFPSTPTPAVGTHVRLRPALNPVPVSYDEPQDTRSGPTRYERRGQKAAAKLGSSALAAARKVAAGK